MRRATLAAGLVPHATRALAIGCVAALAASIAAIPLLAPPAPAPLAAARLFDEPAFDEELESRDPPPRTPDADATNARGALGEQAADTLLPPRPYEERRVFVEQPRIAPASSPVPSPGNTKLDRSPAARRQRVQQYGGSPETEDAVEAGLAWLAAHQSPDGHWDRADYQRRCPHDAVCPGHGMARADHRMRAGLTGLCLLAFLGAGYTDRDGPYVEVVRKAVDALLAMQRSDGGFSPTHAMAGYDNSLATFALAEYLALTGEPRVRERLKLAVERLVSSQQHLGGWDYLPRPDSGRNDTSITGWMTQALLACWAAGVAVPPEALVHASMHFARAAEQDGRVRYADSGIGVGPSNADGPQYRYGPAMTAVGLTCEPLLGWRLDSPLRSRQLTVALEQLPSATLARGGDATQLHDEYYWYYGTVALFQSGGQAWERWNAALRDALLPLQNREKHADGRRKHIFGSWPAYGQGWGRWGRTGGRVYATAICVLTLEVYYRHPPAYLLDQQVLGPGDWRAVLHAASVRERSDALRCLRECRFEIAEPVLLELLDDTSNAIAGAAARALTEFGSPLGKRVLSSRLTTGTPSERALSERALREIAAIESRPKPKGAVRVFDSGARVATLDLEGAYVGLELEVVRDSVVIAHMSVVQRFSGKPLAIAALRSGETPRGGDTVVAR